MTVSRARNAEGTVFANPAVSHHVSIQNDTVVGGYS